MQSQIKSPNLDFGVPGWIEPQERHLLCNLAANCHGPILEVGSWVGLSTLCICEGIKGNTECQKFTSVDLFPTEQNFVYLDEGVGFYVDGLCLSTCSKTVYEKEILPILQKGVYSELMLNLYKHQVYNYVEIVSGNIHKVDLPKKYFHLIFADCCHNLTEFEFNFPRLQELASSDCLYAIHDMHYYVPDIQILTKTGSLQIFQIK